MFNILISAVLASAGAQAVQATPVSGETASPIAKVLLDAVHDADSPPDEKTLRVLCAARVETGPVVSFVGAADGRVLLATFTGEPLVDPGREVGLLHLPRPRIAAGSQRLPVEGGQLPALSPAIAPVRRATDGLAEYLAVAPLRGILLFAPPNDRLPR